MARGPASFQRAARLTRPADFRRVFAGATRTGSRSLTLLAAPNGTDSARLGLAISRKVAPRAVTRNRLKRTIRESFRRHRSELGGWDIVILARPAAAATSNRDLRTELEQHWTRLRRRPCAPS
ncbi:MAG: ribonuclease P protein component [Pseudomonadota bacterium]